MTPNPITSPTLDPQPPRRIAAGVSPIPSGPFRDRPPRRLHLLPGSGPTLATLGPSRLTVSAAAVRRTLIYVILALVLVHTGFQIVNYLITPTPWLYRGLFHLDEESSFPTWYSAVALLAASLLLFVVAARQRRLHDPWTRHWIGLGAGFLLLSIDEVVGLHEALNGETDFSWVLVGAPISLVVFAVYIPFIRRLPDPFRSRLLVAGMTFLTGALVIEYAQTPLSDAGLIDTLGYNLAVVPEETLEMLGIVILLHALIDYLGHAGRITLALGPARPDAELATPADLVRPLRSRGA